MDVMLTAALKVLECPVKFPFELMRVGCECVGTVCDVGMSCIMIQERR